MEGCKSMTNPVNIKENFNQEGGIQRVNETYFRSLIGYLM